MMGAAQDSRVDFLLVGMARSGTTLVQRLLAELTDVRVAPETHFWPNAEALATAFPPPLDLAMAEHAVRWFAGLASSQYLAIDPLSVMSRLRCPAHLWDLFEAIVSDLVDAPHDELPLIGEKTPDHLRWAEQLLSAVPDLRLVVVVRDPREVFRSHQEMPWGITDPSLFAEKWVELSRRTRDCCRLFPDRVLAARYEQVVTDPLAFQDQAAAFLGSQGDRSEGQAAALFDGGEWWKADALAEVKPRPPRWPNELSETVIGQIEAVADDEMRHWEYEPASPPCPQDLQTGRASQLRLRAWGAHISGTPLPVTSTNVFPQQQAAHAASSAARERDLLRRLVREQASTELRALRAERGLLLAKWRLERLQARRWSRIGDALRAWVRRPVRLRLIRDVFRALFGPSSLPARPDLSGIDAEISELASEGASPAKEPDLLREARRHLGAGHAREALADLDRLPSVVRRGRVASLLAREAKLALGDVRGALAEIRGVLSCEGFDPELAAEARRLEGRARVLDPNWMPVLIRSTTQRKRRAGRVLQVVAASAPHRDDELARVCLAVALGLAAVGMEPVVVTELGFPRTMGLESFPLEEVHRRVPMHRLDLGAAYAADAVPDDLLIRDHAALLARLASRLQPELVQVLLHPGDHRTARVAFAVARHLELPFVVQLVGSFGSDDPTWPVVLRVLSEADMVLVPSRAVADVLVAAGLDEQSIDTLPTPVDMERFRPEVTGPDTPHEDRGSARATVGHMVATGWERQAQEVVRAVSILRDRGVAAGCVLASPGKMPEGVLSDIEDLRLAEDIDVLEYAQGARLDDFHAQVDIHVALSDGPDDDAPLTLLEAMASGSVPVVSSGMTCRQWVEPCGASVEIGDIDALAEVVGRFVIDQPRRSKLAIAATRVVDEQRGAHTLGDRFHALFSRFRGGSSGT